ncbi:hypothetical protein F5Y05DRAFT_183827 [Hypoxylon sp. FL0543]|nr:hypothetical protein F5Y05DRAFT_183827 [Hypoxylon sp. FL0543]
MLSRLLEEGQARVNVTVQKGYAPPHFAHNLELIFVEDNRRSESLSMKSKISSTRERAERLRALDPPVLIWWAVAFPMRQWSGGRKTNGRTFNSLIRRTPQCATDVELLLAAVADDIELLRETHPTCHAMQEFLNAVSTRCVAKMSPASTNMDMDMDLLSLELPPDPSPEKQYVTFSGAQPDFPSRLANILPQAVESSRTYQEQRQRASSISTAVEVYVPTVLDDSDAYLVVSVGTSHVWRIMQELGIELEPPRI